MTTRGMTESERAASPRSWDFLLTALFIVVMIALAIALAISSLGSGVINTACGSGDCDNFRVQLGQALCSFGPPVIALVSAVWSIVLVLRRRIGFWVALLGAGLMVAVFLGGRLLMDSGIPTELG